MAINGFRAQDIEVFFVSLLFFGFILYFFCKYTTSDVEQPRFAWNLLLLDVASIAIFVYVVITTVFGISYKSIVVTSLFSIIPLKGILLFWARKYNIKGHFF
jgi:hypothetical protein